MSPEFPDLQEYTHPVTLTEPTQLLAAKVTAHDPAAPQLLTRIFRDVDGDGRFAPVDQNDEVSRPVVWDGPLDEADAVRLPAGKYLVQVQAVEPHDAAIEFDLRTWQVDDPRPDDPAPAPGLVVTGDTDGVWPAEEHTFEVRFNGVDGGESLRGLVEWNGIDDGGPNVLGRSIVRVTPAAAPD